MSDKETYMTHTIQSRPSGSSSKSDTDLSVHEGETEDNMDLLLQMLGNLDNIYEKLSRLDHLMERKEIELKLHQRSKG